MKKTLCLIMVIAMTLAISATAINAAAEEADVKAKYTAAELEDVYSVDVVWGAMEFDYYAGGQVWDATAHKWVSDTEDPAGWTANNDSNEITLTNHSSKAVNATFAFTANADYTSLNGSFSYSGTALSVALELAKPQADTAADEYVVSFTPAGSIPATHSNTTYAKIGTITISLD